MKKYNYIVSVVMLLLSGYIFYESSGYTIGSSAQKNPAVWPCILAGALALLMGLSLLAAFAVSQAVLPLGATALSVPFVAAQIELLKQLDRYVKSELAASVVSSMLAVFITCDEDDGNLGIQDAVNEDEKVTDDDMKLELAPGAVYALPPGKKVTEVNPIRATSGLDSFVTTMEILVGAGLEIPKEVLIKKYDSNYTAARSALLDFWRTVRVYRTRFNAQFNQPVYEMWLAEAVAQGRVEAPGFFDDPAIRQAWSGCMWTGVSMGHVDPLKEVKAAAERINNNISTQEQEASAYDGGDWSAIVRQRRRENAELTREHVPENGQTGGNGGTNDEK